MVAARGEETGVSSMYLPSSTLLLASTLKPFLREDTNFSLFLLWAAEASVKICSSKIADKEKNKRTNLWWDLMVTTSHMLLLVSVLAPLRQRQTGHKTSSNYAASALWPAVSTLEIMVVLPLVVTIKWSGNMLVPLGWALISASWSDYSCNLFWPLNHKNSAVMQPVCHD